MSLISKSERHTLTLLNFRMDSNLYCVIVIFFMYISLLFVNLHLT